MFSKSSITNAFSKNRSDLASVSDRGVALSAIAESGKFGPNFSAANFGGAFALLDNLYGLGKLYWKDESETVTANELLTADADTAARIDGKTSSATLNYLRSRKKKKIVSGSADMAGGFLSPVTKGTNPVAGARHLMAVTSTSIHINKLRKLIDPRNISNYMQGMIRGNGGRAYPMPEGLPKVYAGQSTHIVPADKKTAPPQLFVFYEVAICTTFIIHRCKYPKATSRSLSAAISFIPVVSAVQSSVHVAQIASSAAWLYGKLCEKFAEMDPKWTVEAVAKTLHYYAFREAHGLSFDNDRPATNNGGQRLPSPNSGTLAGDVIKELFTQRHVTTFAHKGLFSGDNKAENWKKALHGQMYPVDEIIKEPGGWMAIKDKLTLT